MIDISIEKHNQCFIFILFHSIPCSIHLKNGSSPIYPTQNSIKMSFFRTNYPYIIVGTIVAYHFGTSFIDYSFERKAKIAEAEAERLKRIKEI